MDAVRRLQKMKERMEELRNVRAKLEGQKDEIAAELERNFNCTPDEAPKKLKELERKAAKLRDTLEAKLEELENAIQN